MQVSKTTKIYVYKASDQKGVVVSTSARNWWSIEFGTRYKYWSKISPVVILLKALLTAHGVKDRETPV